MPGRSPFHLEMTTTSANQYHNSRRIGKIPRPGQIFFSNAHRLAEGTHQIVRITLLEVKSESTGQYIFESRKKLGHPIQEPKKAFNSALRDAGIRNFRFHDLRHTAGTRLAEAGADAFTIKDILGQASIQTSAIYVHATDEGKRHAIAALERYAENHGHKLGTNEKEQAAGPALSD
jgi:integrase